MSENQPEGKRAPGEITDLSRYAKGDRDPAARAAKAKDMRKRRAAARKAAGTRRPAEDDKWDKPHPVNLSARLDEIINALRGDMPMGAWIREAVIEKAAREAGIDPGDLDTARRPVQRRANYSKREQG